MEEKTITEPTDLAFLALLRNALHGGSVTLPDQVHWFGLFQLASRQHVLSMIAESIYQNSLLPEELLSPVSMNALNIVIRQTQRTSSFLALYQYLSNKGICPLVLKGIVCRSLYPQPDQRPSNDEDLLIKISDFDAVHEALLAYGLQCTVPDPSPLMHEITYTSDQLRIELHLSCFPVDSAAYGDCNTFFKDVHEKAVSLEIDGVTVKTLSPDDHILYLICHTYKHFLHSGVGIRQICDIGEYADHYKEDINWKKLRRNCGSIRIAYFTSALFRIAEKYLGFSMPEAFADLKTDEGDLLKDILSGGVYGAVDTNRLHSGTITLEAVAAQKENRKRSGALSSVFLPLKSMQDKYPYLKRYPWLLPGAWVQRIWKYMTDDQAENDPVESIKIGNERVELLKKYRILE